jgi:type I restriction enzyme S subunit
MVLEKHQAQTIGRWKNVRLSTVVERVNDPVAVDPRKMYQEIGIRSHGKGIFHKEPVAGKSLGTKRVYWVHPDCFVFNVVFAWEQAIAVTSRSEKGMIGSHRFPMYRPVKGTLDLQYLLSFFKTDRGTAATLRAER